MYISPMILNQWIYIMFMEDYTEDKSERNTMTFYE